MKTRATHLLIGLLLATAAACGPTWQGGRFVGAKFKPQVVVEYTAEGDAPEGVRYAVVRDGEGVALYRNVPGEGASVLPASWRDSDGDHFVMWTTFGAAEHVVVPTAPGAAAYRWSYPVGLYTVETRDGVIRPVPKIPLEAITKLTPAGGAQ